MTSRLIHFEAADSEVDTSRGRAEQIDEALEDALRCEDIQFLNDVDTDLNISPSFLRRIDNENGTHFNRFTASSAGSSSNHSRTTNLDSTITTIHTKVGNPKAKHTIKNQTFDNPVYTY